MTDWVVVAVIGGTTGLLFYIADFVKKISAHLEMIEHHTKEMVRLLELRD